MERKTKSSEIFEDDNLDDALADVDDTGLIAEQQRINKATLEETDESEEDVEEDEDQD